MMRSLKIQLWINMDFGIRETGGNSMVNIMDTNDSN